MVDIVLLCLYIVVTFEVSHCTFVVTPHFVYMLTFIFFVCMQFIVTYVRDQQRSYCCDSSV